MNKWMWVVYPILAAAFIGYTAITVVSDPVRWMALSAQQQDIAQQQLQIEALRQKISQLDSFDKVQAEADMQLLLEAVPPSRLAWSLVTEIKNAATDAGVQITDYKGQGGEIKEASVSAIATNDGGVALSVSADIPDIVRLRRFLATLFTYYPLVRLNSMMFDGGVARMTLEGAWSPRTREVQQEAPLPQYAADLATVKKQMEGFLTQDMVSTGSGMIENPTTNPF